MDPEKYRDRSIAHERALIETCRGWKRDARKLVAVTPAAIAEFDQQMDEWIARAQGVIDRLEAERPTPAPTPVAAPADFGPY